MLDHTKTLSITLTLTALMFTGCALEDMDGDEFDDKELIEEADEPVEKMGTECAAATATATFIGGIDYTSPQTYNTPYCWKGVVLDVQNYAQIYTEPGDLPGMTEVRWDDSVPSNQTDCNKLWLGADLFERINNTWVYLASKESFGSWSYFFGGYVCWAPGTSFSTEMKAGRTYRISASARTYKSSSAPTRKLHVESLEAVIIR